MNIRTSLIASSLVAASLISGTAHAALQGRDLNGSAGSFEAYYDTVLDITWLANANYGAGSVYDDGGSTTDGRMTWAAANVWAANLSFTDGVNVYDNWRLPTVDPVNGVNFNYNFSFDGSTDAGYNITSQHNEMAHLFYVTLGNPGDYTPAGIDSGCYSGINSTCLDNVGPFTNLQAHGYWSGLEYAPAPNNASSFYFSAGNTFINGKGSSLYALAVSSGDVAAVPEAETYALMLAGLGLIGWRARRRG